MAGPTGLGSGWTGYGRQAFLGGTIPREARRRGRYGSCRRTEWPGPGRAWSSFKGGLLVYRGRSGAQEPECSAHAELRKSVRSLMEHPAPASSDDE